MSECLRFLFWNIHKSAPNIDLITLYGANHNIDIIMLCEVGFTPTTNLNGFHLIEHIDKNDDIAVLAKTGLDIYYTRELKRYCILRIGNGYSINLAVVHLNSDLHSTGKDYRVPDIEGIKKHLAIEEEKYNNKNTLIVGDFNEDPYSDTMTGWYGFNSVFFKTSIGRGYLQRHDEQKQDVYCQKCNNGNYAR